MAGHTFYGHFHVQVSVETMTNQEWTTYSSTVLWSIIQNILKDKESLHILFYYWSIETVTEKQKEYKRNRKLTIYKNGPLSQTVIDYTYGFKRYTSQYTLKK